MEGAFTMEIKGAGIDVRSFFFICGGVNWSILLVSISTPRNGILLLTMISFLSEIENRIILKGLLY